MNLDYALAGLRERDLDGLADFLVVFLAGDLERD